MRLLPVLLCVFLLSGCALVPLTDGSGRRLDVVQPKQGGLALAGPEDLMLNANVKGSIYETGEQVSVFGTCLDSHQSPIGTGTFASMSSWYPNGTQFFSDVAMQEIQPGYFVYIGPMSAVQGTYLTEMTCHMNASSATAKAWGEWQNPLWVEQIAVVNSTVANLGSNISMQLSQLYANLSQEIVASGFNTTYLDAQFGITFSMINQTLQQGNLTLQQLQVVISYLQNLSSQVSSGFNLTWQQQNATDALINQTFNNLSQQIVVVGQIANGSVDRNNSYLAQLLQNLTSIVTPPAPGSNLTFTETADTPGFLKTWHITVDATDPLTSKGISYPDALCSITTTLTPLDSMAVQGSHFTYSVFINVRGDFSWTVQCVRA